MPFFEDRGFHGTTVGQEEGAKTAGETVAVDVGKVFVVVLLFHWDLRQSTEVSSHVLACSYQSAAGRAHRVCETCIGGCGEPGLNGGAV